MSAGGEVRGVGTSRNWGPRGQGMLVWARQQWRGLVWTWTCLETCSVAIDRLVWTVPREHTGVQRVEFADAEMPELLEFIKCKDPGF